MLETIPLTSGSFHIGKDWVSTDETDSTNIGIDYLELVGFC